MKESLTEIVFILDRSGSMGGLETDTIGGFNAMLERQKKAEGEVLLSTLLFSNETEVQENASRRNGYAELKRLLERQKERYGWEFLFLGANMDAVAAASRFGIDADRAVRYHCDSTGIALNYEAVGEAILTLREKSTLDRDWGARIREDYQKRERDIVGFHNVRLT